MRKKSLISMILVLMLLVSLCVACSKASSVESETVTEKTAEVSTEASVEETTVEETTTEIATKATTSEKVTKATTEKVTKDTKAETTQAETTTEETTPETTAEPETTLPVETTEATTEATTETTTPAPTPAPAPAPQIPGVVCWGDSITYGFGGEGSTYPDTLRELLNGRGYNIPVVNNGICGETTYSILARSGKINFYLEDMASFKQGSDFTEVTVTVDGGHYLNLCGWSGEGLNPVNIGGVVGELVSAGGDNGSGHLYGFRRYDTSAEVNLSGGTMIETYGRNHYPGYVNILLMGQNGTYSSDDDLLYQNQLFVDGLDNDRYIIIGLITGDSEQRDYYDFIMEQRFGRKYISMRKELIARGRELTNTPEDWCDGPDRESGRVYQNLWSDSVHMRGNCYRAMGIIVYERMLELGYIQ